MSNERWSVRNDALTEFSYGTNENQYTGIYLNHQYLDDISVMESPNSPERNGETINNNTRVVHILGQSNQPQQNSATRPRPLIHIDNSNETPRSLNVECNEPVVKSYYRNNTSPRPINMNNVVNIPNIRNKRPLNHGNQNRYFNQPYLPTRLQHLMPAEQIESGPFSPYRIVNASPSTSTAFRTPDRHQYSHNNNNNSIRVPEYPSSPYRCEPVIKYCQQTENDFETFDASERDPRLVNRVRNTYRSDNFEELTPLRYTKNKTYLDEHLRIVNMKLKNVNSSYRFGVVNDLRSADDFNIHNIRSGRDPRVQNTQNDRESETYIDCDKHLNILNTERYKKLNDGKMIGVIDIKSDDEDAVNDIETTNTSNVVEQYHKNKKKKLRKSSEDDQKELTETVENIIFNLDDDISDLRRTTRTLSKKNDANDFNDQTKNNIKKANQNILTVENSSVGNTHQNVNNIFGSIETYQNYKQVSGQSIELVDLAYEENTVDVRTNQNVDTGMFTTKLKDMLLMSTVNEDKSEKINKSSENSEKRNTNKNETSDENIVLNEDRSVVDQRKTSKKKSHKHKSKKRNKSKDNNKHSEMYKDGNSSKTDSGVITIDSAFKNTNSEQVINSEQTSDEQTNNAGMWTKLFKQQKKTDKNELISMPYTMVQRGNQTPNVNKKFMKNTCDMIEHIQNEIFNLVESINSDTYVGEQSNPNTYTARATSVTDVGEKTHYAQDQISIRVQDPNETTESNFPNKNHRSSIDFENLVPGRRGTNEDSLKSNTIQLLPNLEQDESGQNVEEPIIESPSENMSNRNSTIDYAASDFNCESNEASFENVDDEQNLSYYTEYQSTGTNETDIIYESNEDASQSQTNYCMFDNSPSVDRGYNSALDLEKEVPPYIKLSDQILNENSISCDGNDFNYNMRLIKQEHFEVSNYEENFTIDMECTDTYETGYRTETLEDNTQSPRYAFIDDEQPDVHNVGFGVDNEEPVDPSLDNIVEENSETRDVGESNIEGLNIERNVPSEESEDPEVYEIIDNVWSAKEQPVGEHFEMDYFYNIIKINPSLFRVNLHTEDDIFNFIQLYSQRTQTSWRVLKSFKSQKFDVCKIFGCLHNGLSKLLKKPEKKIKPDKCECQSEIDIKIKCSTIRGKNSDPYLKNGLPAIVRFKNEHNHLVPKVTELPLLKSITDNNIQIKFDKGLEPAKIRQAYNIGISPNSSPPVINITNLSDDDVEIVEITDLDTSDQITENNLFGKWEDANIQCDTVETKNNKRLEPGQQVVNNGERANDDGTSHQLVDTSYRKDYSRTLKGIISDHVKAKWLSDKMTTEADHVSLYKCSGKKCNEVFSRRKTFVPHLNDHCCKAKSQKKTHQFMLCMYCFKSFDMINIDALANHIFDNYSFCKYFCKYCLYRAYTASHVLVHEYIIHGEKKPSILQLKDRGVNDNSKEIVKVVDFNKFVLRYVCNIGNCAFYSYMNSDFLYHLSHDHVECGQFYCNICDKPDENGFVAFNPRSFVKHFNVHNINTYQCIFCLFGAELLNHMIIHLAMEHFEYEPLCLERSPINMFCDDKKIENLIILNIKKSIPAGIIKVVNKKSLKELSKKKCQTDPADTICTNAKSVNIDNTTQVSKKSIKELVRPSKHTLKPAIDNKNNTIISDGAKKNVPRDEQQIPNVEEASIGNEEKKSSQLSIYEIMNNSELKKNFGKPFKEKGLKTPSSDDRIDRSKKHANKRLDNTCKKNEICQTSSRNTSTNTKTVDIEKTTQILRRSARNVHSSKNTINPEIVNKNNTVISDKAKRNVPKDDAKRFPNSGASIEKEKKKTSQLAIHDIRKNNTSKPEIDNKNNTVISDKAKRNVQKDDAKRFPNSGAPIEKEKKKTSQLAIHDIRKNNTSKPEIDNKNNTVISDEMKRNVPKDDAKRFPNSGTSIEKEKKKTSQLAIHDIIKNNTSKPEIDNKNNTVISDEMKRNVPRDYVKRIPNSGASIENDKNKSSQLTIHDIIKNIKSKKAITKPVKENSLEITSSDESIEQCKLISKKSSDKVITAGISYQDHLNKCPTENPMECNFCQSQEESTFDIVKAPRLPVLNRFTCTFCNLELPSSDTAKSHVKEEHNVSNIEFVPVNINATDIEKDRFLVCEDKCLKRQKRANDSSFSTEIRKTIVNMKRSKVVSKDDDLQFTTIGNTTNTSKQQVERNPNETQQQHKTMKRKYSNESTNNVTAENYKKTLCWKRLYDNISGITISMFFSPRNIDNIPLTPYFSNPVGCLLCRYHTKVRSNLVSHLNRHGVEPVVLNKHISKSVVNKLKPAATVSEPVNNSLCSSSKAKQNEKVQTVENSIDESTINTIKPPSLQLVNHTPKFVPKQKRFRCALPNCFHFSENFENLQQHITKNHSKFSYFVCPHCRPLIVTFDSFHALVYHYNFHGSNLYICQYCDYIHYDRSKIETHQTRKHPFRMGGENNLNIVAIRKSNFPDIETSKWQCNICEPGIKYTETQIGAHLSIVHKMEKMFKCPICQFDHSDYDVFEQHFTLHHPSLHVKNLYAHFEKISPDVELEPADKRTNVDKQDRTKESHSLNVPEAFYGSAELRAALPSPRETPIKLTSVRKTSAKSLDVLKDQGKTLDNPSSEPNDYSKLKCSTAKYECPVCNEFAVEEKESFREHLLKEINSTLWKCLVCFAICNSEIKMKAHVLKHNRLKRKFEKIEITKKSTLVDGIIDYQNMLMEHKLLKKNNQHTDCDDQNGAKHGNVQ